MGSLGDKFKKLAGDQTRQLLQNFQNAQSSKTRNGYSYGKLNEDGTATLADGTVVQTVVKGRPGQYAPVFNLGNGQGLVDQPEAKFFNIDSNVEKYYYLYLDQFFSSVAPGLYALSETTYQQAWLVDIKSQIKYGIPSDYLPDQITLNNVTNQALNNYLIDFSLDSKHIVILSVGTSRSYATNTLPPSTNQSMVVNYSLVKNWYINGEGIAGDVVKGSLGDLQPTIGYTPQALPYYHNTGQGGSFDISSAVITASYSNDLPPDPAYVRLSTNSSSPTLAALVYDVVSSAGDDSTIFDLYVGQESTFSGFTFEGVTPEGGDAPSYWAMYFRYNYGQVTSNYFSDILNQISYTKLYDSLEHHDQVYTKVGQGVVGPGTYYPSNIPPDYDLSGPILLDSRLTEGRLSRTWLHYRSQPGWIIPAGQVYTFTGYTNIGPYTVPSYAFVSVGQGYINYTVADTATESDGNFFTPPTQNPVITGAAGVGSPDYYQYAIGNWTSTQNPVVAYDYFSIGLSKNGPILGLTYPNYVSSIPTLYLGQYAPYLTNQVGEPSLLPIYNSSYYRGNGLYNRYNPNTGSGNTFDNPGAYYKRLSSSKYMFTSLNKSSKQIGLRITPLPGQPGPYLVEFTPKEGGTLEESNSWDLSSYVPTYAPGQSSTGQLLFQPPSSYAIGYR